MKTLDFIQLNESGAKQTVDALQNLLADLQVYYSNLRSFHWNIKGRGFFELHKHFEEMYTDIADKVDEVAERILMLGSVPENKFSEYLKVARIKEVGAVSDSQEAIHSILDTLTHLIAEERKIIALAGEYDDEVTIAQLSDYLVEQEKLVWMLTAYLAK